MTQSQHYVVSVLFDLGTGEFASATLFVDAVDVEHAKQVAYQTIIDDPENQFPDDVEPEFIRVELRPEDEYAHEVPEPESVDLDEYEVLEDGDA